jgi:hypothetical protein
MANGTFHDPSEFWVGVPVVMLPVKLVPFLFVTDVTVIAGGLEPVAGSVIVVAETRSPPTRPGAPAIEFVALSPLLFDASVLIIAEVPLKRSVSLPSTTPS